MIVRPKRIYRKRIPYGMQNFEDVIKEDCFYVDKTPFIEDIEGSNKYFFYIYYPVHFIILTFFSLSFNSPYLIVPFCQYLITEFAI